MQISDTQGRHSCISMAAVVTQTLHSYTFYVHRKSYGCFFLEIKYYTLLWLVRKSYFVLPILTYKQTNKQTNKQADQQIKGNLIRNCNFSKVRNFCQGQPSVIACPGRRTTNYTTDQFEREAGVYISVKSPPDCWDFLMACYKQSWKAMR
jgi:hypothetical protein